VTNSFHVASLLLKVPDTGVPPFWKGVLWACKAAKIGYCWKVGNGKSIRFWEDRLFGNYSLAIQFWPLYVIVNEKGTTIDEVWDGTDLKLTFRRTVSEQGVGLWYEICSIAESLSLIEEEDRLIWSFSSSCTYSFQSLYGVTSFRGVKPIYPPTVWGLKNPPRVHVFLWLLSNNKLLTLGTI
jgi:hypothetical protein